jgi:EAL domain-containing protein (putative c-di-GMP-specific phosphodiesterase class I)
MTLAFYAIVAFVGLRNSLVDLWVQLRAWLYRPAPSRAAPSRATAGQPALATTSGVIGDWASVLHYGTPGSGSRTVTSRPVEESTASAPGQLAKLDRRGASSSAESGVFHQYTFFTVFQPIADLGTGEAVGYEALTRFADGQSPQESLASAREAGIGVELDLALAHAAVTSARALPPGTWLSINVSPGLAQQAEKLSEILADSPCPLVIEIGDSPEAEDLVEGPLRRIPGVTVAIDDAGSGYESLARITRLRPSYMKLHRDAIVGIEHDAARQMFVTTLVSFARQHDCRVIAEGVETEAERDALCAAGVELGQGYFVGRPVPVDRMEHAPARS